MIKNYDVIRVRRKSISTDGLFKSFIQSHQRSKLSSYYPDFNFLMIDHY